MERFVENLVYCGYIDFYCLVCNVGFTTEFLVEEHIKTDGHKNKFKNAKPSKKKLSIYKIRYNTYFCVACNKYLDAKSNVYHHIADNDHIINRIRNKLPECTVQVKRDGDRVYINRDIDMDTMQWNGIEETKGVCKLCGINITDAVGHKKTKAHMLKLIGNTININNPEGLYRFVGDKKNKFQCLVCSKYGSLNLLNAHWRSVEHVKVKNKHASKNRTYRDSAAIVRIRLKHSKSFDETVSPSKKQFMKEDVEDNIEPLAKSVSNVDLDAPSCSTTSTDQQPVAYSGNPCVTYLPDMDLSYCSLCGVYLSTDESAIMFHLEDKSHKAIAKQHDKNRIRYKKMPIMMYLKNVYFYEAGEAIVINTVHYIGTMSFNAISPLNQMQDFSFTFRCHLCGVNFIKSETINHCKERDHRDILYNAEVFVIKGEFVRQLTPCLYQCGICNAFFSCWDTLSNHIASKAHITTKKKKMDKLEALKSEVELKDDDTAVADLQRYHSNRPESLL